MSDDVADKVAITRADVLSVGYRLETRMDSMLRLLRQVTKRLGVYRARYGALYLFLNEAAAEARDHARILRRHQLDLGEMVPTSAIARCEEEAGDFSCPARPETVDELYAAFDHFFEVVKRLMRFYERHRSLLRDRHTERFVECVLSDWDVKVSVVKNLLEGIPRDLIQIRNVGPVMIFVIC